MARRIGKWRAVIADKTDRRVRLLAEVLSAILLIKMNTWEKPYTEAMTEARGFVQTPLIPIFTALTP